MTTTHGFILQRQEGHPHNPGWWRFGRPSWVATEGDLPATGFPESVRWTLGTPSDLATAQAEWDQQHPRG